ncbi:MAG: AMP-binding protein [Thermoplasmata archaeon]
MGASGRYGRVRDGMAPPIGEEDIRTVETRRFVRGHRWAVLLGAAIGPQRAGPTGLPEAGCLRTRYETMRLVRGRMLEKEEAYHDLATLVRAKALRNKGRPALQFPERTLTYEQLDRGSDRVAAGLVAAGVRPGDRVAALLFNTPEFPLLWFGTAKSGAVLVPLNTGLKGTLLRYELEDSQAVALVLDGRLRSEYEAVREGLGLDRIWQVGTAPDATPEDRSWRPFRDLEEAPGEAPQHTPNPWDPAAILYTSGTTGPPKGAVIPHEKYLTTPREIGARSLLTADSVLFTALPLFHCNAQEMTALTALENDLVAAFDERFQASRFWEAAARVGATHVSLLISMINVLYKQPERPTDRSHSVRVALTAGATREIWPGFEQRFGVRIVELYGMTECGCTTLMNPPGAVRLGSVGTPLPFVEALVVDDHDRPVPVGERGELVVRPRQPYTMFLEYHRKPEQTVEAWRNLWFHTGDFVTRDSEGYYYFVDRKKDVIRRRGENLAPYDVESVLNAHPAVFESVVVGVPSPLGEEDVKAFVRLRPEATASPEELFHYCAERLPFFMVPRFIEFIAEIPKTANQKAQRYLLRTRPAGTQFDREAMGITLRPPGRPNRSA